jgi:hypothetical protein
MKQLRVLGLLVGAAAIAMALAAGASATTVTSPSGTHTQGKSKRKTRAGMSFSTIQLPKLNALGFGKAMWQGTDRELQLRFPFLI